MSQRLAVLLIVMSFTSKVAAEGEGPQVGADAGTFMLKAVNTEALNGQSAQIRLDDYLGTEAKTPKKAVLLAFFASWCEPCKKEMPYLSLMYEAYGDKGLQVLSITIDKEADKIEVAHNLARQNALKYPVLSDHYNILARRYAINHLPAVYLINASGKFAWINIGYGENASKQLLEEVRKGLGIAPSESVPETITAYLNTSQAPAHAESVAVPGTEKKPDVAPHVTGAPAATKDGPKSSAAVASDDADDVPASRHKFLKKKRAKGKLKHRALADD